MAHLFNIPHKPRGSLSAQQIGASRGTQAGPPRQPARPSPPFGAPRSAATPGVVPPPAAPIYSTLPPESAVRFELEAESSPLEKEKRLRVAIEAARMPSSSGQGLQRRPTQLPTPVTGQAPELRQSFDPVRAAQTGLLNLAWSWQQADAPIRAIHTYMELLARYPGTPVAAAAVADLVELSQKLVEQGRFHMALGIYDEMEQLHDMCEEG